MENFDLVNLDGKLDVFELPCCPFCDNEIAEGQRVVIGKCSGSMFLAHLDCAEDS